jgi:3-deoxy-D-manno-octulosonic-acid transferase
MLEPVSLDVPVVVGPHLHNFEEISEALFEAGAALRVRDRAELEQAVSSLLSDARAREAMAESGSRLIEASRGASQRLVDIIDEMLVSRRGAALPAPGAAALRES